MALGNTKNYIVNYEITSSGNAGSTFKSIAEQAKAASANIEPLKKNIEAVSAYLRMLKQSNDSLEKLWTITPKIDTKEINAQIKEVKAKAIESANQIARAFGNAYAGHGLKTGSNVKSVDELVKEPLEKLVKARKEAIANIENSTGGELSFNPKENRFFREINTGTEEAISMASSAVDIFDKKVVDKLKKKSFDNFEDYVKQFKNIEEAIKRVQSTTAVKENATPIGQANKQNQAAMSSLKAQYDEFLKRYDDFTKEYNTKKEAQSKALAKYKDIATRNGFPQFKDVDEGTAKALEASYPNAYNAYKTAKDNAPAMVDLFKRKKALDEEKAQLEAKMAEAAKTAAIPITPTTKKQETKEAITSQPAVSTGTAEQFATNTSNIGKAVENVNALREALEQFGSKERMIKLTANVTPATEQINKFLETVRSMKVAIPITFGGTGINTKQAINEATGKITDEGIQANKEAERLLGDKRTKTNKNSVVIPESVKQLKQEIAKLKEAAPSIEITAKLKAGELQSQLTSAIEKLKIPVVKIPLEMGKITESTKGVKNVKGKKATLDVTGISEKIQQQAESLRQQLEQQTKSKPIKYPTGLDKKLAIDEVKTLAETLRGLAAKEKITFTAALKPIEGKVEDIASKLKKGREIKIPFQATLKTTGISGQIKDAISGIKDKKYSIPINVKITGTKADTQLSGVISSIQEKASKRAGIKLKVGLSKTGYWSDLNGIVKDIREQAAKRKVEIPIKLLSDKLVGDFGKILTKLQQEANAHPIKIDTTVSVSESMTKLREAMNKLSKVITKIGSKTSAALTESNTATVAGSRGGGGGIVGGGRNSGSERAYLAHPGKMMGGGANTDFYTRLRAWAYPLTGNTSFGAQTPYALSMMKDMGSMMAVGGAMGAVGTALHQAIDYQNTMKTVQAILQTSDDNYNDNIFNQMQHTVRNVGKETKFTAPQVAGAARFMAMAGLNTRDINNAIRPVADVALIGDTNLATTADKLTNVMTTFGLKSSQMRTIADIMTSTFTRSNTDMMMLAESAKYAGGIAHLYGGQNFMKTFSDTMAMFGVLGNSGIQASSAGTTIRMMYQNLMQPNKNQRATLEKYHIFTRDKNGQPLQMVDILKEIAANVPREKLADAVGNMFRITAQPGAAALATHIYDLVGNPKTGKKGLMEANYEAMGSNVSGQIANQKKMTLSGLMYQVQSAFGEGVLQAVEKRQQTWAGMLAKLRDFFSNPKTIDGLSKIIDLVENMAQVMLKFVNIWAKAYAFAPSVVNAFLTFQMIATQVGYLITPFTQMVSVLHTLGLRVGMISKLFTGVSAAGAVGAVGGAGADIAGAVAMAVGNTRFRHGESLAPYVTLAERKKSAEMAEYGSRIAHLRHFANLSGRRAARYGWQARDLENVAFAGMTLAESRDFVHHNIRLGGTMPGQNRILEAYRQQQEALASAAIANRMRQDAQARMAELRAVQRQRLMEIRRPMQLEDKALMERFARMHPVENMKRSFSAGRALMTVSLMDTLRTLGRNIKGLFANLMGSLAKAVGMLTSPVGLAIGALAALGTAIYFAYKKYKSTKEDIESVEKAGKQAQTSYEHTKNKAMNTAIDSVPHLKSAKQISTKNFKEQQKFLKGINSQLKNNKALFALNGKESSLTADMIFNSYGIGNNKYIAPDVIRDYNNERNRYLSGRDSKVTGMGAYARLADNGNGMLNDAKQLAVISEWAKIAVQAPKTQKALNDMAKAIADGNKAKQKEILSQYKPTSLLRMSNLNGPNAAQRIQDPTIYYEYQYAQYKALQDMLTNGIGVAGHYAHAMNLISNYGNAGASKWKDHDAFELAQQLAQSVTLSINGSNVGLTLDKMGQIDWMTLANTVNNGVPFNFAQQREILQNTYDAIYNDPKIANSATIIKLLDNYLPQIANLTLNIPTFDPTGNYWSNEPGVTPGKGGKTPSNGRKPKKNDLLNNLPRINLHGGPRFNTPKDKLQESTKKRGYLMGYITATGGKIKKNIPSPSTPQVTPTHHSVIHTRGGGGHITSGTYGGTDPKKKKKKGSTPSQKDYASTYGGGSSKPTTVNINIQNLCRFDGTTITKDADDKKIIAMMENKIAEAVMMMSSSALNTAGSLISQGLSEA